MKHWLRVLTPLVVLLAGLAGCASDEPRTGDAETEARTLPLDDLSAFRSVAENWQIVGGVATDTSIERNLSTTPGTGVLACMPSEDARDNIFTEWEHGDLDLELEFLMPRNSNSGVYLQGRYEVQLRDAWGVEDPGFGHTGGIYQRWDESRPEDERGFEGHPPRVNASRAPGEWQRLHIVFEAPRFDDQGRKTENARFVRVELNGTLVQEDVEVTGPTRAAAFDDEQPQGPLMLQGDHGPIAFRDITYRFVHTGS